MFFFLGLALLGSTGETPMPHCSDGIDNDGDGSADEMDPQCQFNIGDDGPSDELSSDPEFLYCPYWDDENSSPTDSSYCI